MINARALTVTAATNTKIYDGDDDCRGDADDHLGRAAEQATPASFTEAYNNRNVGTGKTLTPSGTVNDGNSGNNYTYTFVNATTGVITARPFTVTAAANTKVYDATASAAAVPTITSGALQAGDTANFTEMYDQQERRDRQDADAERDGDRRQQRQQLRRHVRERHDRRDHAPARSR